MYIQTQISADCRLKSFWRKCSCPDETQVELSGHNQIQTREGVMVRLSDLRIQYQPSDMAVISIFWCCSAVDGEILIV